MNADERGWEGASPGMGSRQECRSYGDGEERPAYRGRSKLLPNGRGGWAQRPAGIGVPALQQGGGGRVAGGGTARPSADERG